MQLLRLIPFIILLISAQQAFAQVDNDSVIPPVVDTVSNPDSQVVVQPTTGSIVNHDPVSKKPLQYYEPKLDQEIPVTIQVLRNHPFFGFASQPVRVQSDLKHFSGKEKLFYALIGLLLVFALLKEAFPKYTNDLIRVVFRTTLKQKQVREQLMQTPLPSLLLNIFFVVCTAFYVDIMLQHFEVTPVDNFWLLLAYCAVGLAAIYTVKFVGLKISGWLFNVKDAADNYIFVVFLINKVIGIFLLPFVVLLSFMQDGPYSVIMLISWCGIGIILLYRILFTYASVRNQIRFNLFHFVLYICAFEIAPLLLIYKALLFFFR